MRLKHVPYASEKLSSYPNIVESNPIEKKGKWMSFFPETLPIYLEIGMGKGRFLYELAKRNPDKNYLGLEMQDSVLVRSLEKVLEQGELPNLRLIRGNANQLHEYFSPFELTGFYINFCDPWPKKRHANRRLTSPNFLKIYEELIPENTSIIFKTDNRHLFEYSLETFCNSQYLLSDISLDLHQDLDRMETNIMTEYEEKFQNGPIYTLTATKHIKKL